MTYCVNGFMTKNYGEAVQRAAAYFFDKLKEEYADEVKFNNMIINRNDDFIVFKLPIKKEWLRVGSSDSICAFIELLRD